MLENPASGMSGSRYLPHAPPMAQVRFLYGDVSTSGPGFSLLSASCTVCVGVLLPLDLGTSVSINSPVKNSLCCFLSHVRSSPSVYDLRSMAWIFYLPPGLHNINLKYTFTPLLACLFAQHSID